jgi:hypothetical protein
MTRVRLFAFFLVLGASIVVWPPGVHAQEQPPAEGPSAERVASVRVWIFPGTEKDGIQITFSTGEESEKKVMARTAGGESRSEEGYQPVAAAQLLSEIRVGDRVVSSTPVNFRKGSSYTMVVWSSGGKWEAKLFPDTSTPQKSERQIRVVNFADGREALLRIDGAKPSPVTRSGVAEFPAPASVALIDVEVLDTKGGPPALSSVEIDFSAYLNSYVVIAPDYRGRMRPRVIGGGRTKESLAAEAAAAAVPSP